MILEIERKFISYVDHLGKANSHYILIAKEKEKGILLSHVNIYLAKVTGSSKKTSLRYSSPISMFYKYLSTQDKYCNISVADYHSIVDNDDIKRWQVYRQQARADSSKYLASSKTIFEDAKIVLGVFYWLKSNGYINNVDVNLKTWVANFKNDSMLNYLQSKEGVCIDSSSIRILDKERRQSQKKSIITIEEIRELMEGYKDPVYTEMFRLSLGTAMRPSELCNFPYYGSGQNSHIMPFSTMDKAGSTVPYTVLGKGRKTRTIRINLKDLASLEFNYITPFYRQRAELYEIRFGKKCPLSQLFLTKRGIPVTPENIAVRTHAAKLAAMSKNPGFRSSISFYDARHWWPTQFLINIFGNELLTHTTDVIFSACAEVLRNQMGHESLETTYKHYIDLARVVLMAHKGIVNDLVTEAEESVDEFINRINESKRSG